MNAKLINILLWAFSVFFLTSCSNTESPEEVLHPVCEKDDPGRTDAHTPQSMIADWGDPVRLGDPINTLCPEDAIEISADGQYLYYMFIEDLLENMSPGQILKKSNNTYQACRINGPVEFETAVFFDLGKGTGGSLDGELSFSPDGSKVYFHSNRASNLGYNHDPFHDDFLDIYVADLDQDGMPGMARNLGPPVNSICPDGEHAIHPNGNDLYFTSLRPGGQGGSDIYVSHFDGNAWQEPVNLGDVINSVRDDLQPAFTSDGDTMYFASDRNAPIGMAIYRSHRTGDSWSGPQLVIRGIVGEPSLTADSRLLYFVHVLSDGSGTYDADIWYCRRSE